MRARTVKIGNSQGVRIPKALLEESGLSGDVDMSVRDGTIVIATAGQARAGWDEAFRQIALHGDDELLDGDVATSKTFNEEPWAWEQREDDAEPYRVVRLADIPDVVGDGATRRG